MTITHTFNQGINSVLATVDSIKLKEDINHLIVDEEEAIASYTNVLYELDTEEDRDLTLLLMHIRKEEIEHKQELSNFPLGE